MTESITITPFMNLKLGTFKNWGELKRAIEEAGMSISDRADDMADQPEFVLALEQAEVKLVCPSVSDLGFPEGSNYRRIRDRARELGLFSCPPEVGPQLRLQCINQPSELIVIAMEPIIVSGQGCGLFVLDNNPKQGPFLGGCRVRYNQFWQSNYRFVFIDSKE
jgi:hypothetical protein